MRLRYLIPCLLLTATAVLAQGTFYRAADGQWKPLKATTAGAVTKFTLAPEDIGGGTTLVVVDKPKWMVLDDDAAPAVVKLLLNGQERKADDLDLGPVAKAPAELAFAVKDDKNPLDLTGLRVTLNGSPLPAGQVTVAKLEGDKFVRVAVKLGDLAPAKYVVTAEVADLSPARNTATLALKFSTAPLITNGNFEDADNTGKPVAWTPGSWGDDPAGSYEWSLQPGGTAGQKALRLAAKKSGNFVCYQEIDPLKVDTPYVLSGQCKGPGCAVSIITYDANGKQLDYLTQGFPAAKEWAPLSYEFKVQPHVKASVVVRSGAIGESWFDDLKLNLK